jgi:hypothetical protein
MNPKNPQWSKSLSVSAWVNQVAISNNGRRVIGATFIHDYEANTRGPNRAGLYGVSAYDQDGNLLWNNSFSGWDGVFAVAVSGDGETAAGGGWASAGRGFLQVYAGTGGVKLDVTAVARIPFLMRHGERNEQRLPDFTIECLTCHQKGRSLLLPRGHKFRGRLSGRCLRIRARLNSKFPDVLAARDVDFMQFVYRRCHTSVVTGPRYDIHLFCFEIDTRGAQNAPMAIHAPQIDFPAIGKSWMRR